MTYLGHIYTTHGAVWDRFLENQTDFRTPSMGMVEWLDTVPDELLTLLELSE